MLKTNDRKMLEEVLSLAKKIRSLLNSKRQVTAVPGVSMANNPARFWPCFDQRLQDENGQPVVDENQLAIIQEIGIALQCISHRHHNATTRMLAILDREFLDTVVSVVTYLLNANNKAYVLANGNALLFPRSELDAKTAIFSKCREEIDRQAKEEQEKSYGKGLSFSPVP